MTFVTYRMWGSKVTPNFLSDIKCVVVPFTKRVTTWRRKSMGGRRGMSLERSQPMGPLE